MEFQDYFPIWNKLNTAQQDRIMSSLTDRNVKKGTVIYSGSLDCTGLFLVKSGQLRAYILSDQGREITLYRLFDRDMCLFSASCMIHSMQFEMTIEAEKDTELWMIPAETYKALWRNPRLLPTTQTNLWPPVFSEVMWLIEQILWKSLDKRVAEFLLEEAAIEDTSRLKITHEAIANHLGSHREVITRMLRYFQNEGMVKLSRGMITILDEDKLEKLRG